VQEVRTAIPLLAAILVGHALYAQEQKPWNVDRLCGRIEYVQKVPARNLSNTVSEKRKNLRGLPIELYEWRNGASCCGDLTHVGATTSGKGGHFEFKPEKPGHYWLTAKWNEKEYKVDVIFEPHKNSTTVCSEQGIQVDDAGNASWWLTITVD
jgi:hypothetical protein